MLHRLLRSIGRILLAFVLIVGGTGLLIGFALFGPESCTGGSSSVSVKGHQRKDGTTVRPHTRRRPKND